MASNPTGTILERELADDYAGLWNALQAVASDKLVPAGTALFRQGTTARGLFLVYSGEVRLTVSEQSAASRVVDSGSVLGLPALFSGEPYSLTAVAVGETEVGFVSREAASELFRSNAELCLAAAKVLAGELRDLRQRQAQSILLVRL